MKNKFALKHIFVIILALLTVVSVTSCNAIKIIGGVIDAVEDIDENNSDEGTEPEKGTEPNEEAKPDKNDDNNNIIPEENKAATITEQICFEYNGIVVTAKEIVDDQYMGAGIKFHIENNSDTECSISIDHLLINNCMTRGTLYCTVDAGKKAYDTLYFSYMDDININNVGLLEIYFEVFNSETYKYYNPDCVTIKTSVYDQIDMSAKHMENTLYDANGIKISAQYIEDNGLYGFGASVALCIENNGDKPIWISCDSMSINGYMISGYASEIVYQGKYSVCNIDIFSSDLEENDITRIEEIELKFRIYDNDTYDTILITDYLTLTVD